MSTPGHQIALLICFVPVLLWQVSPFFNSLGFVIPERKGEADFLQEVTSRKDQAQYWAESQQAMHVVGHQQQIPEHR